MEQTLFLKKSNKRVALGSTDRSEWLPDVPTVNDPIYVNHSKTDGDHFNCGNIGDECKSIQFSLSQWVSHRHEAILICSENIIENKIDIIGRAVNIRKADNIQTVTIKSNTSSKSFVSIGYGSLSVEDITICHDQILSKSASLITINESYGSLHLFHCNVTASTSNDAFYTPFFQLEDGKALLEDCNIHSITFDECSLFTLSKSTQLVFNGAYIKNIVREKGDGPIFSYELISGERFEIANVSIENCSSTNGNGGGIALTLGSGCHFSFGGLSAFTELSQCTAQSGNGGGIYLNLREAIVDFSIINPSFTNNNALYGRDLFVSSPSLLKSITNETITYFSSTFTEEEAMGIDGATPSTAIPLLYILKSREDKISVGEDGNDIVACGFAAFKCQTILYSLSQQAQYKSISFDSDYHMNETLSLSELSDISFVGKDQESAVHWIGCDIASVGVMTINCVTDFSSITFLLQARLFSTQTTAFYLQEDSAKCTIKECTIKGDVDVTSVPFSFAKVEKGSLIVLRVTAESLSFSNAPFVHCIGSTSHLSVYSTQALNIIPSGYSSLILLESNSYLTVTNTSFISEMNGTRSLIEIDRALESEISNNTFSGIVLSSGNGAVISGTAGSQQIIKIDDNEIGGICSQGNGGGIALSMEAGSILRIGETKNVIFNACKAQMTSAIGGFGGGIYLNLVKSFENLKLNSIQFIDCSANRTGTNLFLRATNFSKIVNKETFGFSPNTDVITELNGYENNNETYCIPLVTYLRQNPSPITVGGLNKFDFERCGYNDAPCVTIDYAFDRWNAAQGLNCVIVLKAELFGELSLSTGSYSFLANDVQSKFTVSSNPVDNLEGLIKNSVTSTFKLLMFALPNSFQRCNSLFFSSSGTLTIDECTVATSAPNQIQYAFAVVTGGLFCLTGLNIDGLTFSSFPFIELINEASSSVDSCIFSSVKGPDDKGIIYYTSTGTFSIQGSSFIDNSATNCPAICDLNGHSLNISECTFDGLWRREGNGGAVNALLDSGQSIFMPNNTFDSCQAMKGCGGGAYVSLSGNAQLKIGNNDSITSFEKCAAKEDNSKGGYGGALMLICAEQAANFVLRTLSFGSGEAANVAINGGKNIFLECGSLQKLVHSSKFAFQMKINVDDQPDLDEFMGTEENYRSSPVPLVLFLRTFYSPCVVGNGGMDYSQCGFKDFPCLTIPFAAEARFPSSNASIQLLQSFSFLDHLLLSAKPISIASLSSEPIEVLEGGIGEGDALIETKVQVTFDGIVYSLPQSFNVPRKSFLLCSESTLTIANCVITASLVNPSYSFLMTSNGNVEIKNFTSNDIAFATASIFVFSGRLTKGTMKDIKWVNVTSSHLRGLISVSNESGISFENSTVSDSKYANSPMLTIDEKASVTMNNNTYSQLTRENGNGCVVNGNIGDEKVFEAKNCSFTLISCLDDNGKGGSVKVITESGGTFSFIKSTINESSVEETPDGQGGGIHLTLSSVNAKYGIKADTFVNNKANIGKDIYLQCQEPSVMLNPSFWEGSIEEDFDEDRFWVYDNSSTPAINISILAFLFPEGENIVFVNGNYTNGQGCGTEPLPCKDIGHGFKIMKDSQNILRITDNTFLDVEIARSISLNIQGKGTTQLNVAIERDAHFVLNGNDKLFYNIRQLAFTIDDSVAHEELFSIFSGQCSITNCTFMGDDNLNDPINLWIAQINGGSFQLDKVLLEGFSFGSEKGIIRAESGTVSMQNSTFRNVNSDLSSLTFLGSTSANINDNCTFENFTSLRMDGGAFHIEIDMNGAFEISNSTIEECKAGLTNGKGGGIFLNLVTEISTTYLFSELKMKSNIASVGRDIFFFGTDLNASIDTKRFLLNFTNEVEGENLDLMGQDASYFKEGYHNLLLFLVQYLSSEVFVSSIGFDMVGCGSRTYPCASFWRGYQNIQKDENIILWINAEVQLKDCYDLSSFTIQSISFPQRANLTISQEISDNSGKSIIMTSEFLIFDSIAFILPSKFNTDRNSLVSTSGQEASISFQNCIFQENSMEQVKYSLLSASGSSLILNKTTISLMSFTHTPFQASCQANIENCSFSSVKTPIEEGGALKVSLSDSSSLLIKNTTANKCEASLSNGKGGFLYLDCTQSSLLLPFVLDSIVQDSNNAKVGKCLFVSSFSLNKTVTNQSFLFPFESYGNDSALFAGKDGTFNETDLLRFLISYTSSLIYVSSLGFDVLRCGSRNDPCNSFWTGYQRMNQIAAEKEMSLSVSTTLEDSYVLSDYLIQSSAVELSEKLRAIIFIQKNERNEDSDVFLSNTGKLTFNQITFSIESNFFNEKGTIIESKEGLLTFLACSLCTNSTSTSPANYSFVSLKEGELFVNELFIEQANFGKSVIVTRSNCVANIEKLQISMINITDGSIIEYFLPDGRNLLKNSVSSSLMINASVINSANSQDSVPCVLSAEKANPSVTQISNTIFNDVRSSTSLSGGVIKNVLTRGSSFVLVNSSVEQCSCSTSQGRGGGVYLTSSLTGDLNFLFRNMTFSSNAAKIGRDIFVACFNIKTQINETQFRFELRETHYNSFNAIYGIDEVEYNSEPVNLMEFIVIHQSDIIFISTDSTTANEDNKKCGTQSLPCRTVQYASTHLTFDYKSQLVVINEVAINTEFDLGDLTFTSRSYTSAIVQVESSISASRSSVIICHETVELVLLAFAFEADSDSAHETLLTIDSGVLSISRCSFSASDPASLSELPFGIVFSRRSSVSISDCQISELLFLENPAIMGFHSSIKISQVNLTSLSSQPSVFNLADSCRLEIEKLFASDVTLKSSSIYNFDLSESKTNESGSPFHNFSAALCSFLNVSCNSSHSSILSSQPNALELKLLNCTFEKCCSTLDKGYTIALSSCKNGSIESCLFDGVELDVSTGKKGNGYMNDICHWNGSIIDLDKSSISIKDSMFMNSFKGGLSITGGSLSVEKSEFSNNKILIDGYPSPRRNVICDEGAELNVVSLKGGDGQEKNSSLWFLNEGCTLKGIASERSSVFFIPAIRSIQTEDVEDDLRLLITGILLLPCNISLRICSAIGDAFLYETYYFSEEGYISENEVNISIPLKVISSASEETEVSASILYGQSSSPSETNKWILKNRTFANSEGANVSKGNINNTDWKIVTLILFAVLFLLVFIICIALAVRWRKAKERTEELEEIVNDTVRKDPKAFEMVTMEMSPEEQWRRAEREAEKKNEERIKKRVYEKTMEHSESSEHLLSECGSTEYILGRDSDKIPEWALEKVEEEETRKRTPSPSISSTSTTSTTDSDSSFICGEDLCPTTSSMSNLVDAMACSSPHEKLIVDLRDSLFMLLHGRNAKKEMAIGTLKEREMTAAQILFWVANLALHSFDEMENELSSLANLSPHIVLFSEHMVICIALHSDCSSDSDSSSVSSLTIVSSSSNISVLSERFTDSPPPSSAFEDEDSFKKECLRWKAPELQVNKKMGATKESVAFSIGMMLWECLTLDVPFGEYEAEVAGQKIVNGERPNLEHVKKSNYLEFIRISLSENQTDRPTLFGMKREFITHFPANAVILTITDAICDENSSDGKKKTNSHEKKKEENQK
ncbi:uncharacterized protein MONOS_7329 [Monocercomonoides exilis]|uniref:uncharacterized protein n=1 Tax=Monocercomonoides exilis TaxID=2049356 RepID=UPI00355A8A88|nr:hypothetical protein MONOS_7329 [Monocercomonoides exilis]|eukprot:MONOS_7329.1-p1 / transcript=MONOS_7329.1 / gene=MONOS_7329 / organism=Monocercomonoides_exilis_PA203 / gene_product=unspecified product / transcript_product=unspecified product / location=Mono_scaffold00248:15223-25982(+) / protein_length=3568 / sequence_SO=supercontig / SO=protein_coding / is_pseudo=false